MSVAVMTQVSTETLADFVLKLRNNKGLSQNELARRTGLSNAWFGKLETGTLAGRPKIETLQKLAKGLQVPVEQLMVIAGYLQSDQAARHEGALAAVPGLKRGSEVAAPDQYANLPPLAALIRREREGQPPIDLKAVSTLDPRLMKKIDQGHVPPEHIMRALAKVLDIPFEKMKAASTGAARLAPATDTPAAIAMLSPKVPVPYYGKVGCGDFLELDGAPLDRVGVPEAYLQEGDFNAMAVLVADGTSMNRAGIVHGMKLLVDTALAPMPGDVVIATVPHIGTTCKKLEKRADGLYLVPESSDPHPTIKVGEDVRFNGVVLRAWAEVEFRRGR